jgi:hypothetical protein
MMTDECALSTPSCQRPTSALPKYECPAPRIARTQWLNGHLGQEDGRHDKCAKGKPETYGYPKSHRLFFTIEMPRPGRSNCPDQHLSDAYAIDSESNHYDSKSNCNYAAGRHDAGLTMRLSDAGLRKRQTKALYPNHRFPPWLNETRPRARSN